MIELIQNIFIHHNYLVISDYNDEFQIRYKLVTLKLSIEATVHKSYKRALFTGMFTGMDLCRSLFFNKVRGSRPTTLLKRDSNTGYFL